MGLHPIPTATLAFLCIGGLVVVLCVLTCTTSAFIHSRSRSRTRLGAYVVAEDLGVQVATVVPTAPELHTTGPRAPLYTEVTV